MPSSTGRSPLPSLVPVQSWLEPHEAGGLNSFCASANHCAFRPDTCASSGVPHERCQRRLERPPWLLVAAVRAQAVHVVGVDGHVVDIGITRVEPRCVARIGRRDEEVALGYGPHVLGVLDAGRPQVLLSQLLYALGRAESQLS